MSNSKPARHCHRGAGKRAWTAIFFDWLRKSQGNSIAQANFPENLRVRSAQQLPSRRLKPPTPTDPKAPSIEDQQQGLALESEGQSAHRGGDEPGGGPRLLALALPSRLECTASLEKCFCTIKGAAYLSHKHWTRQTMEFLGGSCSL